MCASLTDIVKTNVMSYDKSKIVIDWLELLFLPLAAGCGSEKSHKTVGLI